MKLFKFLSKPLCKKQQVPAGTTEDLAKWLQAYANEHRWLDDEIPEELRRAPNPNFRVTYRPENPLPAEKKPSEKPIYMNMKKSAG